MFLHPKNAITICAAAACLLASVTANAQSQSQSQSSNSEYARRIAALQQARQRTPAAAPEIQQTAAQVAAPRVARAIPQGSSSRSVPFSAGSSTRSVPFSGGSSTRSIPSGGFTPNHLQSSQQFGETIIEGGSPIVHDGQIIHQSPIIENHIVDAPIGSSIVGEEVIIDDPYSGVVTEGCSDGSCGDVGESYFSDGCCGRGGCPTAGPCLVNRFGGILRNAEYFGGFNSFRGNLFNAPDNSGSLVDDSSHGGFAGFNLGLPLSRISGGLFSGQFGVRTVNTNFGGAQFTDDDRNQIFITAGLFRRVDYGLQGGVVADVLREEWFSDVDLVQIRGELGYVWQNGTSFGFRFATNAQDETTDGEFNNTPFANNFVTTNDWYRFFVRHESAHGGYGEIFGGWTDNEQGIIGLDFDFPVRERIAMEAGFTYFLSDEEVPANQGFIGGEPNDSFNIYVGLSLRPLGRSYYRSYERPLFDVADNGTLSVFRQ